MKLSLDSVFEILALDPSLTHLSMAHDWCLEEGLEEEARGLRWCIENLRDYDSSLPKFPAYKIGGNRKYEDRPWNWGNNERINLSCCIPERLYDKLEGYVRKTIIYADYVTLQEALRSLGKTLSSPVLRHGELSSPGISSAS